MAYMCLTPKRSKQIGKVKHDVKCSFPFQIIKATLFGKVYNGSFNTY